VRRGWASSRCSTRRRSRFSLPSHSWERDGDHGGNLVHFCAPPCKAELHGFWDNLLGTSSDPNSAARVETALPAPAANLASKSDAADWVQESFEAAQSDVYVMPIGAGTGPFTVSTAYNSAAKSLAKKRVALAGARLANLLNTELK